MCKLSRGLGDVYKRQDDVWGYFIDGSISKIIIALCFMSIAYSIYNERKQIIKRRREAAA